jgi:hypothetical protein
MRIKHVMAAIRTFIMVAEPFFNEVWPLAAVDAPGLPHSRLSRVRGPVRPFRLC